MAEMLLLNPKKRRRARKKNPAAKRQRRASSRSANPRRRRRNPLPMFRRNKSRAARRRRNPIGLGKLTGSSIFAAVKDAAIGAGGALAIEMLVNRISPMLPAAIRPIKGKIGAGDAIVMLATIVLGRALRGVTRGASMKMAQGALTVQAVNIARGVLPVGALGEFDDLGYYSPAAIVEGDAVIGPAIDGFDELDGVDALTYTDSAMLNAFVPGQSPVLNESALEREGVSAYR